MPLACAQCGEEVTQQGGAFAFKHLRQELDPVIETGVAGEVIERAGRPPLRIVTAEDDGRDTGQNYGPHAHSTGFQSDIQDSIKEPPGIYFPGGLSYGDQFCMPGGVLTCFAHVMTPGDDSSTLYNNAADRHLVPGPGFVCLGNGPAHPVFMAAGGGGGIGEMGG